MYSFKVCPPLIAKQQFLNGLCSVINHTSHSESFFIMARKITQSESQPRTARPRKAGCSSSATCSSAKKKPNKKIQTKSGKVCRRPVPPAIEDLLAGAVGLMSCCHIAVIYHYPLSINYIIFQSRGQDATASYPDPIVHVLVCQAKLICYCATVPWTMAPYHSRLGW